MRTEKKFFNVFLHGSCPSPPHDSPNCLVFVSLFNKNLCFMYFSMLGSTTRVCESDPSFWLFNSGRCRNYNEEKLQQRIESKRKPRIQLTWTYWWRAQKQEKLAQKRCCINSTFGRVWRIPSPMLVLANPRQNISSIPFNKEIAHRLISSKENKHQAHHESERYLQKPLLRKA